MNVLLAHNFYQQAGGEDQVFADEAKLLEDRGHVVGRFAVDNDSIDQMSRWTVARKTLWNTESCEALHQAIRAIDAKVVHFHNTFPLISPAAYYAAHEAGAAVVQTLHNYRLMCVTATLCRDARVCEDCLGRKIAWPGILHKCYRGNRAASAVVAAMQTFHRLRGTWQREVDAFITLSEFGRGKFIAGGLPPEKLLVKPNYVSLDPGVGTGRGGYALFVGRLSEEKGISTLLEAWPKVFVETGVKLKIFGTGPLLGKVEQAVRRPGEMEYLGWKSRAEVSAAMGEAMALVFPSIWYEPQGLVIAESFSRGTPVLASRLGALPERVPDGRAGLLFNPGDADDLRRQACKLLLDTSGLQAMRQAARAEFEARYTAEKNYPLLMNCYERALAARHT